MLLNLQKLYQKLTLPKDVFNFVSGYGKNIVNKLVQNEKVGLVSFTGSVEIGAKSWKLHLKI